MFDWLKNLISTFKLSDPMIMQFENMMIAEEAAKQAEARTTPVTPKVEPVKETPAAPKRSRGAKGKFVADVKTTTETNEAWVGGKAPAKKIIKRNTKSKNK